MAARSATRRPRAASRGRAPFELTPGQARRILDYDHRLFDRYLRFLARRSPRLGARDRGTAHGSWIRTMAHILNAQEAWLVYIVPGRMDEFERRSGDPYRRPTTWAGVRAYSREVWKRIDAWSRSATPAEMRRRVRAPWMPHDGTVSDAILQVSLEEAHHLGEVIATLWQVDQEPPEMTWLMLLR